MKKLDKNVEKFYIIFYVIFINCFYFLVILFIISRDFTFVRKAPSAIILQKAPSAITLPPLE